MGVNSLLKTVTRQRRGCDLNPGPSAPESNTLTTRLPSQPALFFTPLQIADATRLPPDLIFVILVFASQTQDIYET